MGTGGTHAWSYAASGTAGNTISFTQAMTLDASGNLGVGTTSPASRIHAQRSDDGVIGTFRGTSNAQLLLSISSGNLVYDASNGNATHVFQANGTERARITSGGELCVGTTSSSYKLQTAGDNAAKFQGLTIGASGGEYPSAGYGVRFTGTGLNYNYDAGDYAVMIRYGQNSGRIETFTAVSGTTGNAITFTAGPYVANLGTSWTNSSDERLKNITGEIQNGLSKVCSLRAAEFTWKVGGNTAPQVGLIAQDVLAVLPEAVVVSDQEFDGTTATGMGVNYDQTIPLLVAAIKELKAELDAAKVKIAALESK